MLRTALKSLALVAALGVALPAAAATVTESSVSGGDFSGNWQNFTVLAAGTKSISGTWSGSNDYDYIALQGLSAGIHQLVFTFSPVLTAGSANYSYSGGGVVKYSTTPLQYSGWDGSPIGQIDVTYPNFADRTITFSLTNLYQGGTLYLSLLGTNSSPMRYNIALDGGDVAPAPVPLPAGVILLGTALGGFGILRRRRRAA